MKLYQQYLEDLTKTFDKTEYTIISRAQNQFANDLATLASMVEIPKGVWTRSLEIEQSYELVHKGKTKSLILAIEEEGVACSLLSAGNRSNIILRVLRPNHKEQDKFKDNIIKQQFG